MIPRKILNETVAGTTASSKKFHSVRNGGNLSLTLCTAGSDGNPGGTVRGAWHIYGSNAPGADVNGDPLAPEVTAQFTQPGASNTAIAAVTADSQASQGVQGGPFWFAYIAAQFVPTAGSSLGLAYLNEAP